MALQRPVPPPRRSLVTKSVIVTPAERPTNESLESKSRRSFSGNGNTPLLEEEEDTNDLGKRSITDESFSSTKNDCPTGSSLTKNDYPNGSTCGLAVENPGYDSSVVPRRPKSKMNAERTSNLMWFKSDIIPDFTVGSLSNCSEKVEETSENLSPFALSPIDDPSLPSPIPLPPDFPSVASIYPKLPPSPIPPESSSPSFPDCSANDSKLDGEHCHGQSDLESPRDNYLPNVSSSGDSILDARSSPHSMIGQTMWVTSLEDSSESVISQATEEKSYPNLDSCNRMNGQVSTDGSFISNTSEKTETGESATQESWIQERPANSGVGGNERLRLKPVGANVCNAGWLNKIGMKKKEPTRRWCVLKNCVFEVYYDDTSDVPIESVPCKWVEIIHARSPSSQSVLDGEGAHSFTISFLIETTRKVSSWTFSADCAEDLLDWMTLLTRCIVQGEAASVCEAIDLSGPLYLKKGTTADWEPGWFVMRGKVLLYGAAGDLCCYEVDIRKVIRVRTITDSSDCCPLVQPVVPFAFVVSTEGSALYAQSRDATTTRLWRDSITEALTARTGLISEHRLAMDDIPIIVEKCISFVAVYGLNVEGIYRHSGTQSKGKQLLEVFVKDPYAMHLLPDEYTVHDVTGVLRKYFRTLDDPLITAALRPRFLEESDLKDHRIRVAAFKRLLDELPLVNYSTLRKLLRHLKTVSQHADKNMMTVSNLASIFGPTLFFVDKEQAGEGSSTFFSAQQANRIIADMIVDYDELFNVDNDELQKEKKIEEALRRIESHNIVKTPSQLLLSIHVFEKDASVFNMQVTNKLTASEVCQFAVSHKKLSHTAGQLALFEIVCNGQLERVMAPDEKLLDLISRWSSWPLEERAANYVIVKPDYFKERLESMTSSYLLTSCDVQFSESKSFRKCTFQCSKGEVLMYKNAKGSKPLQSWGLDKLLWYFGRESRRHVPTEFVLTFVEKDVVVRRSKNTPFFGHCVCFHDESDLLKWLATVTLSNRPLRTDF